MNDPLAVRSESDEIVSTMGFGRLLLDTGGCNGWHGTTLGIDRTTCQRVGTVTVLLLKEIRAAAGDPRSQRTNFKLHDHDARVRGGFPMTGVSIYAEPSALRALES